jgi:redox-sensitive bicupin YhaK (pirin superfamily)
MQILSRDKLARNRFQGVREFRLVRDDRISDASPSDAWQGLGQFVYMADACFIPHGQTQPHEHQDIDVISVMLEGRIEHEGSLEHGGSLLPYDVQVQRSGSQGFSHNEINPDDTGNRMLQLWVLPEHSGGPAAYRHYRLENGRVTRVYGGVDTAKDAPVLAAATCIDIARLQEGQSLDVDMPAMIYVCLGRCFVNEETAVEGNLLRDGSFTIDAIEDTLLVIIHELERQADSS